jgi:hypothetical protein
MLRLTGNHLIIAAPPEVQSQLRDEMKGSIEYAPASLGSSIGPWFPNEINHSCDGGGTITIHGTPKRSVTIPKLGEKNVVDNGS